MRVPPQRAGEIGGRLHRGVDIVPASKPLEGDRRGAGDGENCGGNQACCCRVYSRSARRFLYHLWLFAGNDGAVAVGPGTGQASSGSTTLLCNAGLTSLRCWTDCCCCRSWSILTPGNMIKLRGLPREEIVLDVC